MRRSITRGTVQEDGRRSTRWLWTSTLAVLCLGILILAPSGGKDVHVSARTGVATLDATYDAQPTCSMAVELFCHPERQREPVLSLPKEISRTSVANEREILHFIQDDRRAAVQDDTRPRVQPGRNGNSLVAAAAVSTLPPLDQQPLLAQPIEGLTADAAFVVDIRTDDLLYSLNADQQLSPASTSKMITALTAIRVLDPAEQVEVMPQDLVDNTVYSNAALQAGDIVAVRDLLAGALIPSGGDAAQTLAREAGTRLGPAPGQTPMERFVEEMNAIAERLGMRNSNFTNPVGMDDENQYSTARDLAIAGEVVLRNKLLRSLVSQTVYEMTVLGPNARSYEVYNTNQLLPVDRVNGIKTGTTPDAGENLVLATERSSNPVIVVILGSDDRYADTQAVLSHVDERITWVEFGASDDFPEVRQAAEQQGFVVATPMVRPMRSQAIEQLHAEVSLEERPSGSTPTTWGHVVFLRDGEELYRIPVLTPR